MAFSSFYLPPTPLQHNLWLICTYEGPTFMLDFVFRYLHHKDNKGVDAIKNLNFVGLA